MGYKLSNFEFNLPVPIYFGDNSTQKLPEICKKFGTNILLVTSKDIQYIEKKILSILETSYFSIETLYLESPEPTCSYIDSTAKYFSSKKFDCIIGLGGGSAMDMAKSLSIALTNQEPIWSYANLSYRPPKPILKKTLPVILIPTTSGTGSEVTPYAVLTNSEIEQKGTIQEVAIFSKAAIIDPSLMLSMPNELSTSTGMDAFAHALESCLNISKFSPVSEWAGIESMKIIFHFLPKVIKEPSNLEWRMNMAWASTLAGIAITHRGTTTAHAIAETLGALTKIPHAHCVTISTMPTLKYTYRKTIDKLVEIYDRLYWHDNNKIDRDEKAKLIIKKVENLIEQIGMKRTAKDYLSKEMIVGLNNKILNHMLTHKFRPLKQHVIQFSNNELLMIINEIIGAKT